MSTDHPALPVVVLKVESHCSHTSFVLKPRRRFGLAPVDAQLLEEPVRLGVEVVPRARLSPANLVERGVELRGDGLHLHELVVRSALHA